MDKPHFIELLEKYQNGSATNEERHLILSYYELFENEPDVMLLLDDVHKEELKGEMLSNVWRSIGQYDQARKRSRVIRLWSVRAAAAAAILIIITPFFLYRPSSKPRKKLTRVEQQPNENRFISLPDGSVVILNSGSKLDYPSSFDGLEKREVYLQGHAYFDIKHNPGKEFIVHIGKLKVTILGTAFDIKAWPSEAGITVTVARGKVKVSDDEKTYAVMVPGEQLTYHKEKDKVEQQTVKFENFILWKEQDLLFDNVTVAEAANLLGEKFKVNFVFSDDLVKSRRFTTTFLKEESLDHILTSICEFNNAVYYFDKNNNRVTIANK